MLRIPFRLFLATLGGIALPLAATEKLDLKRVTPVAADQPIPIQDFFRAPLMLSPKLNPSGTHIAALVTGDEDKYRLLVYELATGKIDWVGIAGDCDVGVFNWLGDRRFLFAINTGRRYSLGLMRADLGRLGEIHPVLQNCDARLIAVPRSEPTQPLIWIRRDGETEKERGLVTVRTDIHTSGFRDLTAPDITMKEVDAVSANNDRATVEHFPLLKEDLVLGYMADIEGRPAHGFSFQGGKTRLHRIEGKQWVVCPVDLDNVDVFAAGNQPGEVAALTERKDGKPQALVLLQTTTGEYGETLVQDDAYDFTGWVHRDPATRAIIGASYERDGPRTVWFDEGYQKLHQLICKSFPGQVVQVAGIDRERNIFLVFSYSDRQPVIYSWVDLGKRKAGLVKNSMPWIDPKRMQSMNIVKFKTRDGRQLDAYVTLPAGATKENPPPLVVLPHGGPWVRDTWGFDSQAQFLASRGYAVMQPNYRASTGYHWLFPYEDLWAFDKMHDDVTEATRMLIRSGLVDPGRVAIMGGSFGGYLALAGVTREPGLYRCAITMAGVFDWSALVNAKKYDRFDNPTHATLLRHLGDPERHKDKFAAISPLNQVAQIKVPVFVWHGKIDQVVGVNQSRDLIAELKMHQVPHEVMITSEEGHGAARLSNRVKLYSHIEAFLVKNLMPKKPAASQ